MKHLNNGACDRCRLIMDKYPGFSDAIREWFYALQKDHPEAHISCAGRGADEQEALYLRKATKAKYGQSAHNWNAAIDLFEMGGEDKNVIYERVWFRDVVKPRLPEWLLWYGVPDSPFYELPHIELRDWKKLADNLSLRLVEPIPRG